MSKMESKQRVFKPKIVCFICNRSSYALLKKDDFQLPENIRNIRVICLGRINLSFIFKAFELGADGVLLIGCPPGECQYSFGNKLAEEHLFKAKKIGHLLGIEKERLCLTSISIEEDLKFAKNVKKFVEDIKRLGPSPFKIDSNETLIPTNQHKRG